MKKMSFKKLGLFILLAFMAMVAVQAQSATAEKSAEEKYREVVTGRSDKIVKTLGISDSAKYYKVRQTIANQYVDLNTIYADRDSQLAILKRTVQDKALLDTGKATIAKATDEKIKVLHTQFLSKLSGELNDEQVDGVKDGLTYNVLHVTVTAYNDMIPTLTEVQKAQILAWLTEAREYAMDAESSDKKHWWFGKYKGRINNYLSAQGYDLQAERAAWEKRLEEKKKKSDG